MRGSGSMKLLVIGVGCAIAYSQFGPIGCIFVGILLMMFG